MFFFSWFTVQKHSSHHGVGGSVAEVRGWLATLPRKTEVKEATEIHSLLCHPQWPISSTRAPHLLSVLKPSQPASPAGTKCPNVCAYRETFHNQDCLSYLVTVAVKTTQPYIRKHFIADLLIISEENPLSSFQGVWKQAWAGEAAESSHPIPSQQTWICTSLTRIMLCSHAWHTGGCMPWISNIVLCWSDVSHVCVSVLFPFS